MMRASGRTAAIPRRGRARPQIRGRRLADRWSGAGARESVTYSSSVCGVRPGRGGERGRRSGAKNHGSFSAGHEDLRVRAQHLV